jgi:hypothetical protein
VVIHQESLSQAFCLGVKNVEVQVSDLYYELKERALRICRDQGILGDKIVVRARTLSPEEAIGNPEGEDFPLQKGKERLMQAEFRGGLGQAFTDRFGDFEGTIDEILGMPLENNFRRAVFVAALNAVLRSLGLVQGTVHCKDEGPTKCANAMASHIMDRYGIVKITQVGYQPRIVQAMADTFDLRVLDLDPENVGTRKSGILIEGSHCAEDAVSWADVLLVTGTTLTNNTIRWFLTDKPVIFYGTTIAGAAHLMGWERFCSESE